MATDRTVAEVVEATAAPETNVAVTWPLVLEALQAEGIASPLVQDGMIATIGVETWISRRVEGKVRDLTFLPIEEAGSAEYLARYAGYHGRGLIQITWRYNYEHYGARLGISLAEHPELALEPAHAARIAAAYFKDKPVAPACEAEDWVIVRKRVNGGTRGWNRFREVLVQLGHAPPMVP